VAEGRQVSEAATVRWLMDAIGSVTECNVIGVLGIDDQGTVFMPRPGCEVEAATRLSQVNFRRLLLCAEEFQQ
jgi:hypothetical protein